MSSHAGCRLLLVFAVLFLVELDQRYVLSVSGGIAVEVEESNQRSSSATVLVDGNGNSIDASGNVRDANTNDDRKI